MCWSKVHERSVVSLCTGEIHGAYRLFMKNKLYRGYVGG